MKPEQFCYWLQGYFELTGGNKLTEKQVKSVKDHLGLVFQQKKTILNDSQRKEITKGFKPFSSDQQLIC